LHCFISYFNIFGLVSWRWSI